MRFALRFCAYMLIALATGCATYIPPSGRADLSAITSATLRESFAAKPAAGFPAGIAAARVQAAGYQSYYTKRNGGVHGSGTYSVITVKEVEDEADLERLGRLPDVNGIISLNRMLLPETLDTETSLREAAARLKADLLLMYTFETTFYDEELSKTLQVVSLGLSPTKRIHINTVASALLIDTRTGYIHAALESNERSKGITNSWESGEAVDRARRANEKAAFKGLVGEFAKNWSKIVERAKKGA